MQALTHKNTLPLLLVATFVVFYLVTAFPQWDLRFAQMAFRDGGFIAADMGFVHALRMAFWNLTLLMVVVAVIALSLAHNAKWPARLLPIRSWNIILWGYILGPGLLVNGLLKGFSGRARPVDIMSFGGDAFYTAVGQFSGQCASNCSFVSGEVSGTTAFCAACLILIQHHQARFDPRATKGAYALLAALWVFVFFQRVLSGGHFLSDALLGGLLTALVMVFTAWLWPEDKLAPSAP